MIALLGRRDLPTDGLEDYCTFLGRELSRRGVELARVRVAWDETGRGAALRRLRLQSKDWRGDWVLLQYTALSWSRRGFPVFVLAVARVLHRAGAKIAVVLHEPTHQLGLRRARRLRCACQDWVIQRLYARATKVVFTVPLDTVAWLPEGASKAAFIPIGANIPERVVRGAPSEKNRQKTVIVFGVTGPPMTNREVQEIAAVMKATSNSIGRMRLVVIGRGAIEARNQITRALEGANVEVLVRGILPAEEIANEFQRGDALLFVRGIVSPQRGSAVAGIACGLPIVGYRDGNVGEPLKGAGIEWSPWEDQAELIQSLIRVLSDPERWVELHQRNLQVQRDWLSWSRIGERFCDVLSAAD